MKRTHKYNAQALKGKRSHLEVLCEKLLLEHGLSYGYESWIVELIPASNHCTFTAKKGKIKKTCSIRPTTYTPDFVATDKSWVIETKGFSTPEFLLKWKLFKLYMAQHYPYTQCYIAHNKTEILSIINHIQSEVM